MVAPFVSITIQDEKNAKSTLEIYVPTGTSAEDILDFGTSIAGLIVPLITGQITRVAACIGVTPPASALVPGADVEEGGQFRFNVVGGNRSNITIPTFNESLTIAGSTALDTNNADVAAFIDAMTNGVTVASTNTVSPVDYRDGDLTVPVSTWQVFGGRRARGGN